MLRVIANQGDTVDALCWRHLGSTASVVATLEANPGLAAHGPVLPIGTPVDLPEHAPTTANANLIKLWD